MGPWFKGPGSTNKQPFGRGQFRLPRVEGVEGVRLQGECGDHVKYVECSGTQTRRCLRAIGFARSKVLAGNALTIRTPSYRSPRKCCKQKTYGRAKPFRCNTYKKQGVGGPLSHCTSNSFLPYPVTSSSLSSYLLLPPYLSRRSPRCLLHCSTHGTPTPRPTFSRRSPLARRDCARHSRFAAFHRSSPARRSTLLDRNRFRSRRDDPAPPRRRHYRPRHRNRSCVPAGPSPSRKAIPQSHRHPLRHS